MGADEPLEEFAARRDKRLRPVSEKKVVLLGGDPQRASHLAPDTPRLIVEWDGYTWQPVTLVDDYAAACRILNPTPEPPPLASPPTRSPLAPGTGIHRKP